MRSAAAASGARGRARWSAAGERLAAILRARSGWVTRTEPAVAGALAAAWRALWVSLVAVLVLLALGAAGVALWRRGMGMPSQQGLQVVRDYLLMMVEAVVLVAALGLLAVVVGWLARTEPAAITPFTNATATPSLTAVSDLLVGHLDRISRVQTTPIPDIPGERLRSDPITARPENVDSSLANVGSINLGQASISVGQLLITLKRMLPIRNCGTTISGSVQQYGTTFQLVATVRHARLMDTVMATAEAAGDPAPIPTAVPELAYRIHFTLAGGRMTAGSWQLLRSFTEARAAFLRYVDGGQVADRDAAARHTRDAYTLDCTYQRLFGLLYGLGTCYFATGEYSTAIELLRTGLEVTPGMSQAMVQIARCHYAQGQDDDACEMLRQAIAVRCAHPAARYQLGLVYGTAGQRDQAIGELLGVRHHPRSLRSSAWVTIAGLRLQDGDAAGHQRALSHVAAGDFRTDAYARACWLSVGQRPDEALAAVREAFRKRTVPLEYAQRDPDLENLRRHCGPQGLRDLATPRSGW